MSYFYGRIAQTEPNLISEYISILEQGNHNQRTFIIDSLAIGGNETVIEYFKTKLKEGRFINERLQIEWYLGQGIPFKYELFTGPLKRPEYSEYLFAEFMLSGDKTVITRIIDLIVEPNIIEAEPDEIKAFVKYNKDILGRYGKQNKKMEAIYRKMLPDSSGSKRQVLEDIIDRIDGLYTQARLLEAGKNEKPVTERAKAWALGASAVLIERNWGRHNYLSPHPINPRNIEKWKKSLKNWWGVESRDDLLESLDWAMEKGHRVSFEKWGKYLKELNDEQYQQLLQEYANDNERLQEIRIVKKYYDKLGSKSLMGWDMSRYICLCRWGYFVGYLSEQEAWEKIMPVARMLQKTFDSWDDLGQNYLIGRQYWSYKYTLEEGDIFDDAYQRLVDMKSSPWNLYPWNLDLGVEIKVAGKGGNK
jgi:hypothetical protein